MEEKKEQKRSRSPLELDWTDSSALARFVTETGRILPRKMTRLSSKEQRHITRIIKRARNMLFM